MTDLSNAVVMSGSFGLDPDGHLYIDTPTGPQPLGPAEHPLAQRPSVDAFFWVLSLSGLHKQLTPAQRNALADPAKPGLRCLPKLEAHGLVEGTERTALGELLVRVARKLAEPGDG